LEGFEVEAEVGAIDAAFGGWGGGGEDFGDDFFSDVDGDGEVEVLAAAAGVDADDFGGHIDEGPAGVAGVDGGIHLDPVSEVAGFVLVDALTFGVEGSVDVGDDAEGEGSGEAEGGSDGHDILAWEEGVAVAEGSGVEGDIFGFEGVDVHLEDGEVGPVVVADEASGEAFAIGEGDVYFGSASGDVVVGEDMALVVDDDAGADAGLELTFAFGVGFLFDVDTNDGGEEGVGDVGDGLGSGWGVGGSMGGAADGEGDGEEK